MTDAPVTPDELRALSTRITEWLGDENPNDTETVVFPLTEREVVVMDFATRNRDAWHEASIH